MHCISSNHTKAEWLLYIKASVTFRRCIAPFIFSVRERQSHAINLVATTVNPKSFTQPIERTAYHACIHAFSRTRMLVNCGVVLMWLHYKRGYYQVVSTFRKRAAWMWIALTAWIIRAMCHADSVLLPHVLD